MAIDFPNSPTPGQVFQGYYWDNDKQAWRSSNPASGSVITSATTPTGATAGDLWFNTVDGTIFVYYNDGITTQWVEAKSNVDNYRPLSPNYLLNGGFDIWQRGSSVSQSAKCGADQWYYYYYFAMSQIRITSGVPPTSNSAMRVRSDANGNLVVGVMQALETANAKILAGKRLTFSVKLRRSSSMVRDISLLVYKHPNVDQSPASGSWTNVATKSISNSLIPTGSSSSDWYQAYITFDVPADGSANTLWFEVRASGGMDNGVYFEIAEAQLEDGNIPTVFRKNQPNIQEELASCQRYYQRYVGGVGCGFFGAANSSTGILGQFNLPVQMRSIPNVSSSGQIWVSDQYLTDQQAASSSISAQQGFNTNGGRVVIAGFSGLTTGRWYSPPAASIGSGYIDFSAEL